MNGITLVNAHLSFPELMMPNKPKAFWLPEKLDGRALKHVMTLGRIRCCPDSVLKEAAKDKSLANSPIYKLRVIRSQLQTAVNNMSFPFCNGMCRAIPDGVLQDFRMIEISLRESFNLAVLKLINDWGQIREASINYWIEHKDLLKGLTANEVSTGIHSVFAHTPECEFNVIYFDVKAMDENTKIDATVDIIQAKKEIVAQSKEKLQQELIAFRKEMIETLRLKFVDVFAQAQLQITAGKFNQKTFKAVMRQIEGFEAMNVMGDKGLEEVLEKAKQTISAWSAKQIKKMNTQGVVSNEIGKLVTMIDNLGPCESAVQEIVGDDGRVIELDEPF